MSSTRRADGDLPASDRAPLQFARYLAVGVASAAMEFGIFMALSARFGFAVAPSNIVAVTTATMFNFLVNRGWAFKSSLRINRSAVRYLALYFANMVFTTTAIAFMAGHGVPTYAAKLGTMALVTSWNFFLYRFFVFS